MPTTAKGTFDIEMTPAAAELDGAVQRTEFTKTFHGDLNGTGAGLLLSVGNPQEGEAGYVAIETVAGQLAGRDGSFALQQLASMHAGAQSLRYQVVPGSGRDALAGITGTLLLTIDPDGTHHYALEYQF